MTLSYDDASRPRILRGPLLRTILLFVSMSFIVVALMAWLTLPPPPRPRDAWLPFLSVGLMAILASTIAIVGTALASIRVDGDRLQYRIGPVPLRTIPLKDVTYYEYMKVGRLVHTRLHYGNRKIFAPSGLIDAAAFASFLDAYGIPRKEI